MSTRHERLSSAFAILRTRILANEDAKAFQMLERIVNAEIKKSKGKKQ